MKLTKIIFFTALVLFLAACTQEQQNKLSRIGVSWLEGNYKVTYAEGSHVKSWIVKDGKVTSEGPKGYYFFWIEENGKKYYVQSPIERTYIEEIPD